MNLISGTILFTLAYGVFGVAQPSKLPPPVTLFSPQNEVTSQQDVWEDGCPPAEKISDLYKTFEARVLEVIDGYTLIVQAKDARNQHVVTNLLNPPSWILGTWNNSRESNSDRFETFKFSTDDILFSRGLLDTSTVVNFHSRYEDYAVKETIEPGLYRIEFSKGKNEIVYEFKLCELEHCKTPSTSGGLTYSIIRNGKVVRSHETSIQLVLFRWRST